MKENSGFKMVVRIFILSVLVFGLSSCSTYQNKFDCPPGKGADCSSAEEIEQMVNNGQVWKVNGKVKVVKAKKRFRQNCTDQTCNATDEFDDGIKTRDSMEAESIGENYFGEKSL